MRSYPAIRSMNLKEQVEELVRTTDDLIIGRPLPDGVAIEGTQRRMVQFNVTYDRAERRCYVTRRFTAVIRLRV